MARRTAFIGAYGYGNLGDELCLIEAMQAFPGGEAYAFSVDPAWTTRCAPGLAGCFAHGGEMLALQPDRVVFGGGMVGVPTALTAWMPVMAQAMDRGAEVHLHNLGVAWLSGPEQPIDDTARRVFAQAATFTVRDYTGVDYAARGRVGRMPRISFFPEADIAPEFDLADALLPRGKRLLGVSIIPMEMMKRCLAHDAARVRALVAEFTGFSIVPVVSTVHAHTDAEDDMAGVTTFLRDFMPDAPIAAPELLDRAHWRQQMTPRRLKGLIACCDVLLTQRKHNAIHAIGSGVRVIGMSPMIDNSLRRTFVAMSRHLVPGSRCVGLDLPPEGAAA